MSNPFDSAFDDLSGREETERLSHLGRLQEASRRQQQARLVADPYLREVAAAALRKLQELGVEPIRAFFGTQWPNKHLGSRPPSTTETPYWPLGATFNGPGGKISGMSSGMLFLTAEGFFVKDPSLPGLDGFEDLLKAVYLIPERASYMDVSRDSPVSVEESTNRVCVAEHGHDDAVVTELSHHVATHVRLLHHASRLGPIWSH